MKNANDKFAIIKSTIAGTDKGASRPELYPLTSAVEDKTMENVLISVIKPLGFSSHMASVENEDGTDTVLIPLKGIIDEDNLPTSGKLVVLAAAQDREWGPFNGKSGTVKAGTTKSYIVV